jgi:predicted nucleic acid-binding protein
MIRKFIKGPVVIDNTVLSNFSKTNSFYLIKETLMGVPIIMLSVKQEAIVKPEIEPDVTKAINEGWLKVETLKGRQALLEYHVLSKKFDVPSPKAKLGDGEAASLVYAHFNNCVLITDDNGPRKRAQEYGVPVAGTLAILYFAHAENKILSINDCDYLFNEMRKNGGFFPNRIKTFNDVIPEMEMKFGIIKEI